MVIKDGERLDQTGFGNIKVIQQKGMGYGVDAILLAAFAAGETGAKRFKECGRVADLGTGSGIIAFVTAHKTKTCTVDAFELRENAFDRASRACKINELEERVHFFNCDINEIGEDFYRKYDAIVTNPPYFKKQAAIPNTNEDKFTARHETTACLSDFLRKAYMMLKPSGDFYMVHRPDRLVDILTEMRAQGIEPKELQFVTGSCGATSNILLVHGIKGAGSELRMLPEIRVYKDDNVYSDTINRIYERSL